MKPLFRMIFKIAVLLVVLAVLLLVVLNWMGRYDYMPLDVSASGSGEGAAQSYTTQIIEGNVTDLSLDLDAARLIFVTGTQWSVQYDPNYFTTKQTGSAVFIEANKRSWSWKRYKNNAPTITVMVPDGAQLNTLDVNLDAGIVEADVLNAKSAKLDLDAGSIEIGALRCTGDVSIDVDAGSIELDELSAKTLTADCDMGSIEMKVMLTGSGTLDCNMGSMDIELLAGSKIANIRGSAGLGNVTINGEKQSKDFTYAVADKGGALFLDCSMGEIIVKTTKQGAR